VNNITLKTNYRYTLRVVREHLVKFTEFTVATNICRHFLRHSCRSSDYLVRPYMASNTRKIIN